MILYYTQNCQVKLLNFGHVWAKDEGQYASGIVFIANVCTVHGLSSYMMTSDMLIGKLGDYNYILIVTSSNICHDLFEVIMCCGGLTAQCSTYWDIL